MANFPDECHFVVDAFLEIYKTDAKWRKRELSGQERLWLHQELSAPRMKALDDWSSVQFSERLVEPNSGLGKAIKYTRKHWEKLTLFLRVADAPLDNNLCERALKKAIINRNNSYFYKTRKGARVGDLFMSLIYNGGTLWSSAICLPDGAAAAREGGSSGTRRSGCRGTSQPPLRPRTRLGPMPDVPHDRGVALLQQGQLAKIMRYTYVYRKGTS